MVAADFNPTMMVKDGAADADFDSSVDMEGMWSPTPVSGWLEMPGLTALRAHVFDDGDCLRGERIGAKGRGDRKVWFGGATRLVSEFVTAATLPMLFPTLMQLVHDDRRAASFVQISLLMFGAFTG